MAISYNSWRKRAVDDVSGLYVQFVGVTPYLREQDDIFEAGRDGRSVKFTAFANRALPAEVHERLGSDFVAIMRESRRRAEVRYDGLAVTEGELAPLLGEDAQAGLLMFLRVWAEVGRRRHKAKKISVATRGPDDAWTTLTLS